MLEAQRTVIVAERREADCNTLLSEQKVRLASLDAAIEELLRSRSRAGSKLSSKRQQLQQEMDQLKLQRAGILKLSEESKLVLRHQQAR